MQTERSTWHSDGIQPFKSSSLKVWPILLALTNLPPTIRMNKDSIITIAIWAGKCKPPMDIFLKPLVSVLNEIEAFGVNFYSPSGKTNMKFAPRFGLFDLPAKAQVLNMHQYNGKNGCPTCLHPGTWSGSRYYLPATTCPVRTDASVRAAARVATKEKVVFEGIKSGRSMLTGVVDLVNSVPIDYMHCVLEGATKWLAEKWFSSSSHGMPFYVGRHTKRVDSELTVQCPPHDYSRAPRSINHRNLWKASEFRNWLLYYSLPILVSLLPPLYLHHYALLVCALHILLQSRLTDVQIQAAEDMLKYFYFLLPELYGSTSCTLNAHLLIHLTKYVRLWGPLWTQSCLGFESMNASMIHSTRKVAEQLSFSSDVIQTIADKLIQKLYIQLISFTKTTEKYDFYITRNLLHWKTSVLYIYR